MSLSPEQESFLESWLKKRSEPIDPKRRKLHSTGQKSPNPKWNDDAWFEKEYGDPDYYKRIKGLD